MTEQPTPQKLFASSGGPSHFNGQHKTRLYICYGVLRTRNTGLNKCKQLPVLVYNCLVLFVKSDNVSLFYKIHFDSIESYSHSGCFHINL